MAKRKLPAFIILWNKHKQLYMEIFSMALQELSKKNFVFGDEDAISETLSLLLTQVCFNYGQIRGQEIRTPTWEGPINPVSEQDLKGGKNRKRPDFTCKCFNPWASSPEALQLEINKYQKKYLPYCQDISFRFDQKKLFQTCQQIERRNIKPVQFELIHLWIDLRE